MITNEMKVDIFYLYSKAKVWVTRYSPREFTVREMLPEIEEQVSDFDGKHLDKYQLILKPLSEITDEDKKALSDLFEMGDYANYAEQILAELSGDYGGDWQTNAKDVLQAIDFLRSKGYALPYADIDLFESGIAIPKQ